MFIGLLHKVDYCEYFNTAQGSFKLTQRKSVSDIQLMSSTNGFDHIPRNIQHKEAWRDTAWDMNLEVGCFKPPSQGQPG